MKKQQNNNGNKQIGDYSDKDRFVTKWETINSNLNNKAYRVPEIEVHNTALNDIVDKIESEGFNYIKEINVSGETDAEIHGKVYGGLPLASRKFKGNFSFTLNETGWLMYSKDAVAGESRYVAFLSEHNDMVLSYEEDIKKSQDPLSVMKLKKFLKEYKRYCPEPFDSGDSFEELEDNWERYEKKYDKSIDVRAFSLKTDIYFARLESFKWIFGGLITGGVVGLGVTIAKYGITFQPKEASEYLILGGATILGAAAGGFYYCKDILKQHKRAVKTINNAKNLFRDNFYIPGDNALECIKNINSEDIDSDTAYKMLSFFTDRESVQKYWDSFQKG